MENQFWVDGSFGAAFHQGYEPAPAGGVAQPLRPWQFVDEFQQIAGADVEPDPFFFVDAWTRGRAAALDNLRRRRLEQINRNRNGSWSSRTIAALEDRDLEAGLFPAFDETPERGDVSSQFFAEVTQPQEWDREPREEEWTAVAEEYQREGDTVISMTMARALQVLGVTAASSPMEVKAAYRHKVSQWHPDHLSRRTEWERHLATWQVAAINEAYHLLRSRAA